jgi:hypothetical protein
MLFWAVVSDSTAEVVELFSREEVAAIAEAVDPNGRFFAPPARRLACEQGK